MDSISRKRGRPEGAKTKSQTPGKKRAREYVDYRFDNNLRPTKAAKEIAEKHGVETCQIFKDERRHRKSIGIDLQIEANQAKRDYEEMLSAMIGPKLPNDARTLIYRSAINALKGHNT